MDHASPRAEELAAALAGRLIHDVMGRLSGIMSGLDLLADPSARDMHADALNVAAASAMGLREEMAFCRVLYGASAAPMDARMLEEAARGLFADHRASLEWSVGAKELPAPAGRALLGFIRIAAGALAAGGVARAAAARAAQGVVVRVEAAGPRAKVKPEILAGLQGGPRGDGLSGQWAPAYQIWAGARAQGGNIEVSAGDGGVVFEARFPA